MTSLPELIQQSSGSAWLFIPGAIVLGALHGLEPGHSKTMMAAFIVAIRGTIGQAVLLGIAAKRFEGFSTLARRAPYLSGAVLICMGLYVGLSGFAHLPK